MNTYTVKLMLLALAVQTTVSICGDGNDKLCRACTNNNLCTLCVYGFVNSTGLCQSSTTSISNCLTYASNGFCQVCDYNYYVNVNGTCTSIPVNNCARLNATGAISASVANTTACLYCKNNILVDVNGTCNSNSCQTSNCQYCTRNALNNEVCDRCNSNYANYIAANGTTICHNQNSNSNNCYYVSINTTAAAANNNANTNANAYDYCIVCDVNHYLVNGTCSSSGITNNGNNSSAKAFSIAIVAALLALFL